MQKGLITGLGSVLVLGALASCASMPEEPEMTWHQFPKAAYLGVPDRPFHKLGLVRTKIPYSTLHMEIEEQRLCQNYFNKAAIDLLKRAREVGADAVIDVKSVVFQLDGKIQTFETAECVDDGAEGQVLAQGVAVRWARAGELIKRRKAGLPPSDAVPGRPVNPRPAESNPILAPKRDLSRGPARPSAISAAPNQSQAPSTSE